MEISQVKIPTYTATIYCGLKPMYDQQSVSERFYSERIDKCRQMCQEFVDAVGLCVTFNTTEYLYTNGSEPGIVVGLINYPRFPATPLSIKENAITLAGKLMIEMQQYRVTVVTTMDTIMLTNPKLND